MKYLSSCAGLLSVCVCLVVTPAPSVAEDNLLLVLDSSGSMAGQIDGEVKLDIARSAIGELLGKLRPTTRLGLIAYGHRREGDCGDIETIYDVGVPDGAAVTEAIGRLRAVGKTPLSDAVRMAADQLNISESKATVILVSDGNENCGADPCELGRELAARSIDFRVHVIGFDIKSGEDAGLQCLADATGGKYVAAGDATSLENAIYEVAKAAETPTAELEPIPPPEPVAETGIRVDVVVSEGGPAWEGEIGLKILGKTASLDGTRKEIASAWRTNSGHIFRDLSEGSYILEVQLADHPHIVRGFPLEVELDEAQVVTVNMNIGQVRLDASLTENGSPYDGDLGWTVLAREKDLNGNQQQIASFWRVASGEIFWLPAGNWQVDGVIADANYLTVTKELTVEAGGGEAHAISFDVGTVRLDASLSAGGPEIEDQLGWTVLSPNKDLAGNRAELTSFWRVGSGDIFLLPAGNWVISGMLADHSQVTTEKVIDVAPGSEVAHAFDFAAGRVRFDVTVNGQPTADDLGLTVLAAEKDLARKQAKIAEFWRTKSGYIAVLPAGMFELQALLADQADVAGTFAFEIAPGDEKVLTLNLTRP